MELNYHQQKYSESLKLELNKRVFIYIYKYTFLQITFRWIYMYILYACMIIYVSFVWNLCFFLKNSHPKPTKLDLGRDRGHNFQGGDDEKWRKFAKNGFIFQRSNEQKKTWLVGYYRG